ncbi:MAG: hypothetical protein JZU70_05865 [Chlorobium sp.]|jgi:hypothetical protein|nr:hypothetical protein [Chlorobium sp.]
MLFEVTGGDLKCSRDLRNNVTIRFLNQFSTGYGNYTEERRTMIESMTLDDIFSGIDYQLKKGRKNESAL